MKYLKLLSLLLILGVVTAGFNACTTTDDDDDIIPENLTPAITVTTSFQNNPVEVWRNETLNFNIIVNSNSKSKAKLTEVRIDVSFNSTGSKSTDTSFTIPSPENFINVNYAYTVPATVLDGEVITISIIATDDDNKAGNKDFTLNCKDPSDVTSYDAELGAQSNATYGSLLSTVDGKVYLVNDAFNSQNVIDMVYFYGSTFTSTLASPSDTGVFGNGPNQFSVYKVHMYSVRNNTTFKLMAEGAVTLTEFESLTSSQLAQKYTSSSATENTLAAYMHDATGGFPTPSMFAFKTEKNKYGMFYVKNIAGYSGVGSIKIAVRIQN